MKKVWVHFCAALFCPTSVRQKRRAEIGHLLVSEPKARGRKLVRLVFVFAVLLAIGVMWSGVLINHAAQARTYSDVQIISHRHVGLVLGCSRLLKGGISNPFYESRMDAAARLYSAGKVDYLVVSGDNHRAGYDEATDMQRSLVLRGVPEGRIYRDFAGFHTLDSVVRVKDIFGQSEVTIVSQEFHNKRAIYIARHHGIDAIGFNAGDINAYASFTTKCREQISKLAAVVDVLVIHRNPRFRGDKIEIGVAKG